MWRAAWDLVLGLLAWWGCPWTRPRPQTTVRVCVPELWPSHLGQEGKLVGVDGSPQGRAGVGGPPWAVWAAHSRCIGDVCVCSEHFSKKRVRTSLCLTQEASDLRKTQLWSEQERTTMGQGSLPKGGSLWAQQGPTGGSARRRRAWDWLVEPWQGSAAPRA